MDAWKIKIANKIENLAQEMRGFFEGMPPKTRRNGHDKMRAKNAMKGFEQQASTLCADIVRPLPQKIGLSGHGFRLHEKAAFVVFSANKGKARSGIKIDMTAGGFAGFLGFLDALSEISKHDPFVPFEDLVRGDRPAPLPITFLVNTDEVICGESPISALLDWMLNGAPHFQTPHQSPFAYGKQRSQEDILNNAYNNAKQQALRHLNLTDSGDVHEKMPFSVLPALWNSFVESNLVVNSEDPSLARVREWGVLTPKTAKQEFTFKAKTTYGKVETTKHFLLSPLHHLVGEHLVAWRSSSYQDTRNRRFQTVAELEDCLISVIKLIKDTPANTNNNPKTWIRLKSKDNSFQTTTAPCARSALIALWTQDLLEGKMTPISEIEIVEQKNTLTVHSL